MTQKTPLKAYKDPEFINAHEARIVRILSEYIHPDTRLKEMGIAHTVVVFGSARIKTAGAGPDMSRYYHVAEEFAFRLASLSKEMASEGKGFNICTGGGPGIMEAANRGASRAGEKTIGLNISLPFEQHPNKYITPELNFEFHYFFMRKLWFLYHAKALVVFPGGFGTMDELFEALTLIQTGKLDKKNIPVLLYDSEFWTSVINFKKMAELNFISPEDLELFHFFDTIDEGIEFLKPRIDRLITRMNHKLN